MPNRTTLFLFVCKQKCERDLIRMLTKLRSPEGQANFCNHAFSSLVAAIKQASCCDNAKKYSGKVKPFQSIFGQLGVMKWANVDWDSAHLYVRRGKRGRDSNQPIDGHSLRQLRALKRSSDGSIWIFMSERKTPLDDDTVRSQEGDFLA